MKRMFHKNWIASLILASVVLFGVVQDVSAARNRVTGNYISDNTITDNNMANGSITSVKIADSTIVSGDISDNNISYTDIATANSPTDEFCFTYESDTSSFAWQTCSGGTFFDTAGTGLSATGSTVNFNAGDNSITANSDNAVVNYGFGLQVTTDLNVKADTVGGANLATVINTSANGVAVAIDDTSIGVSSNRLYVKPAGITGTELAASVAGAGLTGAAGSPLAVGAGTGITVNANDVAVNSATVLFRADLIGNEVPNEACDGVTVNFTVDNTIASILSVTITGVEQRPTTDFSFAGSTITLTDACATGESILVDYTK